MSQGHMLADVVAIIGETLTQLHRSTHPTCSSLFCFFLFLFSLRQARRISCLEKWTAKQCCYHGGLPWILHFLLFCVFVSSFSCSPLTSVDCSSTQCLNNPNKYFTTEQESADWYFTSVSLSVDVSLFLKYEAEIK